MKTLNIFYLVIYRKQKLHNDFIFFYVVSMIHDSYQDVPLFHSLLYSYFPTRCLQPVQYPLVSLLGVPEQVEDSLLQN